MNNLHLTKELLTLLCAVGGEHVTREWRPDGTRVDVKGAHTNKTAPLRMVEVEAAGWVSLTGMAWCVTDVSGQDWHFQLWELTNKGRAVLDGAS